MKIADVIMLSTRMFKTRPMRTFLTILGVSVGIGTVLFLVSLGYGLQNIVLDRITTADSLLSLDITAGNSGLISLTKENIAKISRIENMAEVSPMVNISSQLTLGDFTGDGLTYAVEPSFFRLGGITTFRGKLFDSAEAHEAVVSSASVKMFNLSPEEALGREISLTFFIPKILENGTEEVEVVKREQKYVIKGVIDDDMTNFVFVPLPTVADLNFDVYTQVKAKVAQSEFMEDARNKVIDMGFLVSSLSDTIDQANKIFRIIQTILALFGLVALVVSAIGMFNTMTIALLERINEIGIMRSIGASKGDIKLMFLIESVLMGLLGGVGGILIGYLGGEIANLVVNLLAKNLGGEMLNLFYRPLWFLGFIIFFSTFIGFLTGVYPSLRASRLNPLGALRYK